MYAIAMTIQYKLKMLSSDRQCRSEIFQNIIFFGKNRDAGKNQDFFYID